MLHGAGIFTYIWVIFGANVGKYSSTMEHMGGVSTIFLVDPAVDPFRPNKTSLDSKAKLLAMLMSTD
jgi:hypothetical protein